MTYSRAMTCLWTKTPVFYKERHWKIQELNENNKTAVLTLSGEDHYELQKAPLKEIRE